MLEKVLHIFEDLVGDLKEVPVVFQDTVMVCQDVPIAFEVLGVFE